MSWFGDWFGLAGRRDQRSESSSSVPSCSVIDVHSIWTGIVAIEFPLGLRNTHAYIYPQ